MHCQLHRGDWSFHLTNEKKKKIAVTSELLQTQTALQSVGLPRRTATSG